MREKDRVGGMDDEPGREKEVCFHTGILTGGVHPNRKQRGENELHAGHRHQVN